MDWLLTPVSEASLSAWEVFVNDWVFLAAIAYFGLELILYAWRKKLGWRLVGDAVTNTLTFIASFSIAAILFGAFYIGALFAAYEFAVFNIPVTLATMHKRSAP
ncbi:MAG: hypothetical protein AAGL49_10505, partial [Pseudomonadota bacterium]